jgi:dihydrofolate reductase
VLHAQGLIGEYRLMVFPVTLGQGTHLFNEGNERQLRLGEAKTTGTGVALLTYLPSGEQSHGV